MAIKEIKIPNIGDASNVEVIEVLVAPGDMLEKESPLVTLESDKASMEIPSPYAGQVEKVNVKIGDKVSEGALILTLKTSESGEASKAEKIESDVASVEAPDIPSVQEEQVKAVPTISSQILSPINHHDLVSDSNASVHAGPAVRRLARELGVNLGQLKGSGPKERVLKQDIQRYVKTTLSQAQTASTGGLQVSAMPEVDFTKFGEIEQVPLSKIKKLTGINVHRSWVTIPHVTQFGQADITDLEEFRKSHKDQVEKAGVKLTPLVFIMKAVVAALKEFPHFNASLDPKGENLILKKYYNLGIAVDTPNGLVVPVVRNVNNKGMVELAKELSEISQKARQKNLTVADMSGSCFTISSLGGIGGTGFTPIINAPDVAILGVSKAAMTPVYDKGQFIPKLMLPLSLSYDHRVIDGADGARFIVYLASCLSDIRTLLL